MGHLQTHYRNDSVAAWDPPARGPECLNIDRQDYEQYLGWLGDELYRVSRLNFAQQLRETSNKPRRAVLATWGDGRTAVYASVYEAQAAFRLKTSQMVYHYISRGTRVQGAILSYVRTTT